MFTSSIHTRIVLLLIIGAFTVHASSVSYPTYSNSKIDRLKNARGETITSNTCIFFTAPHSIYLNNGRYKDAEGYTDKLVRAFSATTGGGYATWKDSEKIKAKKLALKHGKDVDNMPLRAMGNVDPNYLDNRSRMKHGWLKYLREARRSCTNRSPGNTRGMHVDVHGMTDATAARIGEHLVIGTRAMETTRNVPREHDPSKSSKFRRALETHLKDVLDAIQRSGKLTIKAKRGSSKLLPVRVKPGYEPTTCDNIASKAHRDVCNKGRRSGKITLSRPGQAKREKFVGDWGVMRGKLRNTLSRVSTEKALWSRYGKDADKGAVKPFGCAVQIEMSLQLRKLLADTANNDFGEKFANALKKVYREARCSHASEKYSSVQL